MTTPPATSNTAPSSIDFNQLSPDEYAKLTEGMITPPEGYCFHCGDKLPSKPFYAHILGVDRPMCCMGCQLAAQSIVEAGLVQYYLDRTEINRTASLPSELTQLKAYDHDEVKKQFVYQQQGHSVAELSVANLRCAACTWLIEKRLYELDGVCEAQVNLTQQRMRVIWDEDKLPISDILASIGQVGYTAKPFRQDSHEAMLAKANKQMLMRLVVAALGAMQVMMFAVALYFGEYTGISLEHRTFFRWVSLLVSVPVFFYAGWPFYQSAISALRIRQVNMDVPVSLALIITFGFSAFATITGQGETYFDSVSMFIFFLLAGRYVEHNARFKAANMANDLVVIEPQLVKRLISTAVGSITQTGTTNVEKAITDSTQVETVTTDVLAVGDTILIDAGANIPCDGVLLSDNATVSQALLTGESDLMVKHKGDTIVGGSQNDSQPFVMQLTNLAEDSQLGIIDRLINRALSEKPQLAKQADKLARWFVARVLLLSVVVFVAWYVVDPSQAIWATVAVLVATCPCALSLATPIALTVATNRLASLGFLATRGHTLETVAKVTHVAFDKTGTLTLGKPKLIHINTLVDKHLVTETLIKEGVAQEDATPENSTTDHLLALAAALEVGSQHPIAHALLTAAYQLHLPNTENLQHFPAGGIQASIAGKTYRLGHLAFALDQRLTEQQQETLLVSLQINTTKTGQQIYLTVASLAEATSQTEPWQLLACFNFADSLRDDAKTTVESLKNLGIQPLILTGDPSEHGKLIAEELNINDYHSGLTPEDKVAYLQQLQQQDASVMMVGDGINDAPVLAAANVSVAMNSATDLAQVSSDAVILSDRLTGLLDAKRIALKTEQIIKQNLRWAIVYNGIVLVPAAFGYVPPWLAAIGMSISSLVVVMNALRLKRA